MTKPLTPLATLFHWHPLPRALHSRCTVVMTVCVILVNSRPPSYMQALARLAQRAWRPWERASLCQVLVGKEDLHPGKDCDPVV